MQRVSESRIFQDMCLDWRAKGLRIALVPTMGFFHQGHLSLMRRATTLADRVVVSLFVNPAQFGPGEDLEAYPRDTESDSRKAAEAGVDLFFMPNSEDIYAPDHSTWVRVDQVSEGLCGASRPGHFQGVATVVCKLFWLCLPHVAVFGQKDWQQLAVIRRMVRDLKIPVRIVGHPTVRESDGLAMSSRNSYLTPEERAQAPWLHAGLAMVRDKYLRGDVADTDQVLEELGVFYRKHIPLGDLEYAHCVDKDSIRPVDTLSENTVLAVALRLGRARLIDNICFDPDH
jgi:pantoate--beta-alanine ligase